MSYLEYKKVFNDVEWNRAAHQDVSLIGELILPYNHLEGQ